MTKKKRVTAVVALAVAAVLALTGTFAWQSISQTAKNETRGASNPGGRLHDDFNGKNKDIYVENFAGVNIYARVRLDEYMEIGGGAGEEASEKKWAESLVEGAEWNKVSTWKTHIPGETTFSKYWNWETGGETNYMPTFNKNKDSLKADINGTYAAVGANNEHYVDYVDYSLEKNKTKEAEAIYDMDANTKDEGDEAVPGVNIRTQLEEHTVAKTIKGDVLTMQEWKDKGSEPGDYWVWDEDGWAYWANPIAPGKATGLLLNSISLKMVMSDSWYYGINAVGQFITANDLGKADATGFYIDEKQAPSSDATILLEKIGVNINAAAKTEVTDSGKTFTTGTHTLKSGITATQPNAVAVKVSGAGTNVTIVGGTFSGGEGGNNKCVSVETGASVTIEGGSFTVGGDANGEGNSVVYCDGGTITISGGFFQTDCAYNGLYYVLNQHNSNPGKIIVTGGTFVNYDPSTGDDNLGGTFVADGHKVTQELHGTDTWYTVVPA